MSSDLEFGEPLYRACSEPSLPTVGTSPRAVTVMHAEVIDKMINYDQGKSPIYSAPVPNSAKNSLKNTVRSRHCIVTPKGSRPTTSQSNSESPHRSHRKVRVRGMITDVQADDRFSSTSRKAPPLAHRARKIFDIFTRFSKEHSMRREQYGHRALSESPSSGSASPPQVDNSKKTSKDLDCDIRCASLRRTESRLDLKSPNEFPRSILKLPKRGATARDSSASPMRKQSRISQEKIVRSAGIPDQMITLPLERSHQGPTSLKARQGGNCDKGVDGNRSPSPASITANRPAVCGIKSGGSPTAGPRVPCTDGRSPDLLSPAALYSPRPVRGIDIVVLAFGEAGTGKTYTLTGLNKSYADRGLIPRTLDEVVGRRRPKGYDLQTSVSYVEFSENRCYDLLAPGGKPVEVNPAKVKPIEVPSSDEALDLLFRGEVKRKFEKVNLNCGSSVYTIHVTSQALNSLDPYTSFSKIHFVDAPGIETLWSSEKSDPCAISANLDKLSVDVTSRWAYYLSKAIAKPSKAKSMAVYGTSGLVSYLERSFTHGFVALLGTIRPEGDQLRKTLSTLRFGCKVARLHTGLLERHQQSSAAQKTAILKDEIDGLKAQIETSKLISLGEYDRFNVCQGEAQHIERLIKMYLKSNFPSSVSETCLLSTAKPDLILEEIRRQFRAENDFITSHFPKRSVQLYGRTHSGSVVSASKLKSSFHKKRRTRGSRDTASQLFEDSQFKEVADQATKQSTKEGEKEKEKSLQSFNSKGGGPRKSKSPSSRKSVASRKSMGPRKSKAGGGGKSPKAAKPKGKKGQEPGKTQPVLSPIDQAFLERGRKDRVWLLSEFLLRNKDVAEEKAANESFFETAREAKISKAKDLDEYRASLGRTRIWLSHLQSKRTQMDVGPLGEPGAPNEEEKSFLDKEKETCGKIVKAIDELATLHAMLSDAIHMQKAFQEKLQARFKAWIEEVYVDEKYETEEPYIKASQLDKEIPRQTVAPSQQLETKSEIDFLKLQEAFFRRKLPVMPIIDE